MEVHICTFQITLLSCRSSSPHDKTPLQALWRNERAEVVVMGAVRAHPKKGIAIFNQHFEIKTDFLRDPTTHSYHPNTLILQIRHASQSVHEAISSSICKFNLSEILNSGPVLQKSYQAQDSSFDAVLSINCSHIQETGIKRKLSRRSDKRLKSQSSSVDNQSSKSIEREKPRSILKKRGTEKYQKQHDKQYQQLLKKYESQQTEHILTQERLSQAEQSIKEYQHLIDGLSATINQKQTFIVQINQLLEEQRHKKQIIKQEYNELMLRLKALEEDQDGVAKSQIRVKQLETTLNAMKQSFDKRLKTQSQLEIDSEKLELENRALSKHIDQLKKDITQSHWQKEQLRIQLKKTEEQKESIKINTKQWRDEFMEEHHQKEEQMELKEQEYQKMFLHFAEAKQRLKLIGDQVPRHEIVQIEQFYEEKIKQYQQKENNMKMYVDTIQAEMNELECILEEKQNNEQILIDHTKQLQLELDNAKVEINWWNLTVDKELELRESALNGTIKEEEHQDLQERYTKLFNILKENSKIILQAKKSRKIIERLERKEEELNHRLAISNDELKEVKERLIVIIKENKKLLEKSNKKHKELDLLSKEHKKIEDQLARMKEKDKQLQEQNEIYTYRLGLYEKEVKQLKLLVSSAQYTQRREEMNHIQQTIFQKITSSISTPMPAITEDNEQMVFSAPFQSKETSQAVLPTPQSQTLSANAVKELTHLLQQRNQFINKMSATIELIEQEKQDAKLSSVKEELQHVRGLTSKFKLALLRAGQKQAVKEWQSSVRRLSDRVEAMLVQAP